MTIEDRTTKNEAAIRELIDGLVTAIRAKNIDGVMASYATDLVAFDIVPPLQFAGARAYRKARHDRMGVTLRHADCCLLSGPTLRVPSC
jgi:ketosteroid isomerase-like protein